MSADGARILAIETYPGKSHWNFMSAVLGALTDAGHRVTAFTPFPEGGRENYTEVDTSSELPNRSDVDLETMVAALGHPVKLLWTGPRLSRTLCDTVLANGRLREILRGGGGEFDLIIVEPPWADCASHVAAELSAPIVYAIPAPMATFLEGSYAGHVPNPAAVSNVLSRHAVPGTFARRLSDAALLAYGALLSRFGAASGPSRPYDAAAFAPPSVILLNVHHRAAEASRPFAANVVPVGGVHLAAVRAIPKVSGVRSHNTY